MSDERYTVILGDRRYAIHRKWAKPKKPFGFLSDLMVDGDGRVHVAQRGTDQPVVVFDRDGSEVGSWGEGVLAEPHYINAGNDGAILVADRDAHQVLRFDRDGKLLQALGRRHWPELDAPFNHPTAAAESADGEIYVSDGPRAGRLHHAARRRDRPARPRAGGGPREQPRPGVPPRRHLRRRMERLLSSDADLDR
jgi:peptidylglycine monooxygenase